MSETVLVTGATGFIGQRVVAHLLQQGYSVHAFVRAHRASAFVPHPQLSVAIGDMRDVASLESALRDCDWVVHLAAAKADEPESEETNVQGAHYLVEACRRHGVSFVVNVSTQSVKLKQKGLYGRTKEAADSIFHASGIPVTTLRPSIVYGDLQSGIFGSLLSFGRLPLVPVIGPGTATFRPLHRDDLAVMIERCRHTPATHNRIYDAGGPDEVSLTQLLKILFKKQRKCRPLLHIPIPIALLIARLCSILRHPPITRSNVLGAQEIVHMDPTPLWHDISFKPRSLERGLCELFAATQTTLREHEARTLLLYIMSAGDHSWQPAKEHIERYCRTLLRLDVDQKHRIDAFFLHHTLLMGGLDAMTKLLCPSCTLQRKLLIASAIVECTPDAARWMLPRERPLSAFLGALTSSLASACVRILFGGLLLCIPSLVRRNAGR